MEVEALPIITPTPKKKVKRGPSQIDQMPPYNVMQDLLQMPSFAKIGQLLQYLNQRRNLAQGLRRPKIQETNYANQESEEEKEDKSTAVCCYVRIKGNPVVAILDSGAAVSIITRKLMKKVGLSIDEQSNTVVVIANGERTRALGQVKKAQIAIQNLLIPISLQVIDSQDETLLLGTDWFRKTHASLDFGTNQIRLRYLAKTITVPVTSSANEIPVNYPTPSDQQDDELEQVLNDYEEEELSEIEAYMADSQEEYEEETDLLPLDYNPWNEENSVYLTLAFKEEFEHNPAVFLAETSKENIWKIKDDLQVGPLDDKQQTSFQKLIDDYKDICALSQTKIGRTSLVKHKILTNNHDPVTTGAYKCKDPAKLNFLKDEIKRMKENGIIRKSLSPWASPVVIVAKKTGDKRICIDYRKLNSISKSDAYPLPRIDDLLEKFRGANWFSTLDLASGYWQVEMNKKDKEKTAFISQFGLYEFNVMPFGLKNAPATFQRLMNHILQEFLYEFVAVYLDDIIIYSTTYENHIQHLRKVFQAIKQANLMIKLKKCHFCLPNITYLGHVVGRNGLQPDPAKIDKVKSFPIPVDLTSLRSALGLFSYYRRFVPGFSKIAKPLTHLLKKEEPFSWTDAQQKAFDILKDKLVTAPILQYPNFNKPFILYTDASGNGLGAVLSQKLENGLDYVVAYASRSMNKAEQNYGITD